MLFTFSGLDGAGKTTQITRLTRWLKTQGHEVVYLWARGGYTPGFELLKRLMRRVFQRSLPPPGASTARQKTLANPRVARLWLTLAIIDLTLYWGGYLRFQRFQGKVVICDRYVDDTRLDFKLNFPHIAFEHWWLWRLLTWLAPKPDAAFLLWVPVAESIQRSQLKGEPFPDDEQTLQRRLDAYLAPEVFPDTRYLKLDGRCSAEDIAQEIIRRVDGICVCSSSLWS